MSSKGSFGIRRRASAWISSSRASTSSARSTTTRAVAWKVSSSRATAARIGTFGSTTLETVRMTRSIPSRLAARW